jgi:hypothetical protein
MDWMTNFCLYYSLLCCHLLATIKYVSTFKIGLPVPANLVNTGRAR